MNLLQLVLKQMRQRALSTWLTLVSIVLGVALAVAILILYRESSDIFVQKNYGYEVIVGPAKGSPLQLVLNTVYQIDQSPGNIPYSVYEDLLKNRFNVRIAIPYAVGDSYQGFRIVGTLPKLFGFDETGKPIEPEKTLEYKVGQRYELAEGRVFAPNRFEAVIGPEVAARTGLKLGSKFKSTHGLPQPGQEADEHDTQWEVVGILKPTRTAADRVLYIPLISFYAIGEHADALEQQARMKMGLPPLPPKPAAPKPATKPQAAEEHDHDHPATNTAPPTTHDAHDDHDHPATTPSAPATHEAHSAHDGHDHDHDHPASAPSAPTTHDAHDDHDHPAPAASSSGIAAASASAPADHDAHDDHDDHAGHDHAHDHQYELKPDGTIDLKLPKSDWVVSAVLVKTRGAFQASSLLYHYKLIDPSALGVNPAEVMRQFFDTFLKPGTLVFLLISVLVILVAAVGILVSIYNSVAGRMREIAILRALGATRRRILAIICTEAGLIGLAGAVAGALLGHGLAAVGSAYLSRRLGQGIQWYRVDTPELLGLLSVVLIAVLAGLVPALKAYRTPVATNLTSG